MLSGVQDDKNPHAQSAPMMAPAMSFDQDSDNPQPDKSDFKKLNFCSFFIFSLFLLIANLVNNLPVFRILYIQARRSFFRPVRLHDDTLSKNKFYHLYLENRRVRFLL